MLNGIIKHVESLLIQVALLKGFKAQMLYVVSYLKPNLIES